MVDHGSDPAYQFAACGVTSRDILSLKDIHAVPRGASIHLYTAATVTSAQPRSSRFHPTAWVTSSMVSVSVPTTAARNASTSSTSPLADCTTLATTAS